jgi:hypothetical protein
VKSLESSEPFHLLIDWLEIKLFHLFHDREKIWLDPVHALLRWQYVARIEQGPIFRKFNKYD